jgi:hypothetical protein
MSTRTGTKSTCFVLNNPAANFSVHFRCFPCGGFTVPLCRGHHRQLHQAGNEVSWWNNLQIKPLEIAKELWEESLMKKNPTAAQAARQQAPTDPPQAAPQQDAGKLPNEAN